MAHFEVQVITRVPNFFGTIVDTMPMMKLTFAALTLALTANLKMIMNVASLDYEKYCSRSFPDTPFRDDMVLILVLS